LQSTTNSLSKEIDEIDKWREQIEEFVERERERERARVPIELIVISQGTGRGMSVARRTAVTTAAPAIGAHNFQYF
jgi:hypothetical protein